MQTGTIKLNVRKKTKCLGQYQLNIDLLKSLIVVQQGQVKVIYSAHLVLNI